MCMCARVSAFVCIFGFCFVLFETDFGYVTQIALELLVTVLSLSQPTKCQGHIDVDFFRCCCYLIEDF